MDKDVLNNYRDMWGASTGDKGYDILFGGLTGLGQSLTPKGEYFPTARYLGNGLADTGVSYTSNQQYKNYDDMRRMLGAWYQSGRLSGRQNEDSLYDRVLARLSGLKGNLGNWASREFANKQVGDFTSPLGIYNNQSVIPNDIA